MANVQVLGTGCAKCTHLMKQAEEAAEQLNRGDSVEKVEDIVKILDFAPNALPALAIDGTVVLAGSVPSVAEICEVLQNTAMPETQS